MLWRREWSDQRGEPFQPGDLVGPALSVVRHHVNKQLEERAAPRLAWSAERPALELRLEPSSLLGALWLQLASAIARGVRFRRCAECGLWFELSPGSARSDKLYHSNACRTRAFRRRREALALHAESLPVEEIARRVGAEPEIVAAWLRG